MNIITEALRKLNESRKTTFDDIAKEQIEEIVNELIKKEIEFVEENGYHSEIADDFRLFRDYVKENYTVSDSDTIEKIWDDFCENI